MFNNMMSKGLSFFSKKNSCLQQQQQYHRLIHSLRPLAGISQPSIVSMAQHQLARRGPSVLLPRSSFVSTTTTTTDYKDIHDLNTTATTTSPKRTTAAAADPTAKRPNAVCDPYGQGGKPMSWEEAQQMLMTTGLQQQQHQQQQAGGAVVDNDDDRLMRGWHLVNEKGDLLDQNNPSTTTTSLPSPWALVRTFPHVDYLQAARFMSMLCAVAHNQNHYPHVQLERQLRTKQWFVTTTVTCHTTVLQGLSYHDFHIAMMIDVELHRPEVQKLLLRP